MLRQREKRMEERSGECYITQSIHNTEGRGDREIEKTNREQVFREKEWSVMEETGSANRLSV